MFGLTPACSIAPLNPVLSCAVNRGGVGGGGANAGIRSTCLGAVTTGGKPKPVPVLFPASALCLNDSSGVCETERAGLAGIRSGICEIEGAGPAGIKSDLGIMVGGGLFSKNIGFSVIFGLSLEI